MMGIRAGSLSHRERDLAHTCEIRLRSAVKPLTSTTGREGSGGNWEIGAIVILCAALLVPSLGSVPFRRAEIYFADAARTIVETGDWLVPRFRDEPFFDKPPLVYWL